MTESRPEILRELESLIATPELQRPRVYVCPGCGLTFVSPDEHDAEACALSEVRRDS